METIIPAHDQGALSVPGSPSEREAQAAERVARLEVIDPERLALAMHFLIGYQPGAFDAALAAVDPDGRRSARNRRRTACAALPRWRCFPRMAPIIAITRER